MLTSNLNLVLFEELRFITGLLRQVGLKYMTETGDEAKGLHTCTSPVVILEVHLIRNGKIISCGRIIGFRRSRFTRMNL